MTSHERVLTALNHEEPDRVPLFFGTSGVTSILGAGYGRLKDHLGLNCGPARWFAKQFQYVWPDEEVLTRLGSDGRSVMAGPVPSSLAREISDTELVDAWGCQWVRREGVPYYEVTDPPLRHATGISGTPEQIRGEVREFVECLGNRGGGLIGIIPSDLPSLGASQANIDCMVEAFRAQGGKV